MISTHPSYFFDLENFVHKELFTSIEHIWEVLKRIGPYLATQPLGKIDIEIPSGVHLEDAHLITIQEGAIIEPGAYVKGPCIIGKKTTVRHGAYIRGNLITGEHCVIGHDTEIKNAVFLNHAYAAHFAYVGDSILGNYVNLGAGTKCANLRIDNAQVIIKDGDQKIATGLRKFGAIIGDRSQTGCNVVTSPGTLIGQDVTCYPLTHLTGFVPSSTHVKTVQQTVFIPAS